jgi:dTDP-4-amino-4,6-dideoxygalactose transaminase
MKPSTENEFIPFALPEIGEDEIAEVVASLRSGWLTTGPKTLRFEQEFASYLGVSHALAVNSATSGLHLALEASGVQEGDQVIVPVNTFVSTAEVVRYLGADPLFVDIDFETMNLDVDQVEKLLHEKQTGQIKAIIPVHIGGLACQMDKIYRLAKKFSLRVIEDAAHALPTTFKGGQVGNLESDFTVFSFYVTKTLAVGEGGMVICRHEEDVKKIQLLRLHGIDRDVWKRYRSEKSSWRYDVVATGYKYNLSDIFSSIGLHQLKKVESFHKKRASIADRYDQAFENSELVLPKKAPTGDQHAWHLYLIRLPESSSREDFLERMQAHGIGTSVHFIPLHLMTYYRERYGFQDQDFPQAMRSFERLVSLPIYTKLTDLQVERIIASVKQNLRPT